MTDIHHFDQQLAEANRALDQMIGHYRMLNGEHGETANLLHLEEALTDMPNTATAPLLAAAIRRLAKEGQP